MRAYWFGSSSLMRWSWTSVSGKFFVASDKTELSVLDRADHSRRTDHAKMTVTPSSRSELGGATREYSGLSTTADATVVDQAAQSSGTISGPATVSSGATAATSTDNELSHRVLCRLKELDV